MSEDPESNFVNIIDKFLSILNTYLTRDSFYIESHVSQEKCIEWLEGKLSKSNEKFEAFEATEDIKSQLLQLLETEKDWFLQKKKRPQFTV